MTDLSAGERQGQDRAAVGNLAGGEIGKRVPESRRRTWGSRILTSVLIKQEWTVPPRS